MADTRESSVAEDPLQEQMDATELLARQVVGDDDQRFVLLFHSLVNVLDQFRVSGRSAGVDEGRLILTRTAEPMVKRGRRGLGAQRRADGPPADSIYADPVFLANAKAMISDRKRIVGGIPTANYPDCVAIGSDNGWCCTGTLVAPNVVVTAAHCVVGHCSSRVFIGENVAEQRAGQVIAVRDAVAHPGYGPDDPTRDIAVLILADDANCKPRPIAKATTLKSATSVRLAGYGNTDVHSSGGYGIRRMVDVPLAGTDHGYGADTESEFVAGAPFLDRDSCNGDSGGPAYVRSGRSWHLAGATSRATASTVRPCGDGGIYTRIASYVDWMRSVPGGRWTS